ncbi:MAG: outer membrane beta-barrel protein [Gammaproteobacteria bacterium]|nr:outer membrane beta-barrel protein [Gammaproteobacteria bacterium]
MQKLLKISFIGLALLLSNSAHAEWYIGAEAIEKQAIPTLDSLSNSNSLELGKQESDGISLIGGYRTNKFFSLQLEYHDDLTFGIDDMFAGSSLWFPVAESTNIESNAIFFTGISSYSINDYTSLFMKGGVFNWEVDSSLYNPNENVLNRSRGTDIFYGFGANYDLNARFGISAEWERYEVEESPIDYLSTELKFKF